MSETMHDEQTPLKNLILQISSMDIFPLVLNVDKRNAGIVWRGFLLQLQKSALGPEDIRWQTTMPTVPRKK